MHEHGSNVGVLRSNHIFIHTHFYYNNCCGDCFHFPVEQVVSLDLVHPSEAKGISLVAVTNAGMRLYLSCGFRSVNVLFSQCLAI